MTTNSNFNFTNNSIITLELPFSEHIEELRQRIFLVFGIILLLTCFAFIEVKSLVKILELPINNVKFFQVAPGEYFISTIKISFYTGILFSSPILMVGRLGQRVLTRKGMPKGVSAGGPLTHWGLHSVGGFSCCKRRS